MDVKVKNYFDTCRNLDDSSEKNICVKKQMAEQFFYNKHASFMLSNCCEEFRHLFRIDPHAEKNSAPSEG
jgi:hypothetical protein